MLLRTRLTLIFAMLMGGVLFISGFTVYINVSYLLINDMDRALTSTAQDLISKLNITPSQQFELRPLSGGMPLENFMFQVWGADGKLKLSQPGSLQTSLDKDTLQTGTIVLEAITNGNNHLRVLTVPLTSERGPAGVFQIAASLSALDITQKMLAIVLLITILIGMSLSAVISWLVSGSVMQPLESMVRIASQITRLDDLSRRIPLENQRKDEVGVLVRVFNKTLERLEVLFSSQQRFLADVSHDLRTPLTVIKGNADLIRKTGVADEESLASIELEVNHLTQMVGDLLLLAQAESGRLPLDWEAVRLDELISMVAKKLKPLTEGKLDFQVRGLTETWVMGDANRLKQVFINLISNAIKFTPKRGCVTVAMKKSDTFVKVAIIDTGAGIPAKDMPYIFERFFRGEKSRPRSKESGFGLGLSISSWIIRQHHGEIRVKSQVGKGSAFTVKLNLVETRK